MTTDMAFPATTGGLSTKEAARHMTFRPMFGRYEVIGELSSGGMGAVYLARQRGPGGFIRDVALKVMLPDLAGKIPDAARMFLEEMRVLASINHNNVVRILDFGDEHQPLHMVMEYLPGVTLASLRAQLYTAARVLPPDLVAAILAQACRGLHAAHELRDEHGNHRDLVHRDVTPQNIMCCPDGAVKIIDFGIVWAKHRLVESTGCLMVKGKLAYMSPEQASASPLTRRSDLFSVGVILHELLTGQPLFRRDTDIATIRAVLEASAPPVRSLRADVPRRLDELVLHTLARDPAARPESAAVVADELEAIVWEAGGRFVHPEAAARQLSALGASLAGRAAEPLRAAPWFVHAGRGAPPAAAMAQPEGGVEAPRAAGLLELAAPRAGTCEARSLTEGRRLMLQSVAVDERDRFQTPILFAAAPDLLPAPLLVSPRAGSLFIEVERRAVSPGGPRPSIYHDASNPSTRCEGLLLPEVARDVRFDVGHRRARVQRLHCDSAEAAAGGARLRVDIPWLAAAIVADGAAKQLVVLSAVDPATGTAHLACINVF
jgi:serine/threonine-protein kinase